MNNFRKTPLGLSLSVCSVVVNYVKQPKDPISKYLHARLALVTCRK